MTEAQWLSSTSPMVMLDSLRREGDNGGEYWAISQRKFRLYACACARLIWSPWGQGCARAVQLAEAMADGATHSGGADIMRWPVLYPDAKEAARRVLWAEQAKSTRSQQGDLLRDVAGNPYRQVQPATITYANEAIYQLAQAAYGGDWSAMGALSDALEEAGYPAAIGRTRSQVLEARKKAVMGGCCNNFAHNQSCTCLEEAAPDGILEHLRSGGTHARGCWAIDHLLGKN